MTLPVGFITAEQLHEFARRSQERLLSELRPNNDEPLCAPEVAGVYAVQGAGEFVKIGYATNIRSRMAEIQIYQPVKLRLLAVLSFTRADEKRLHRQLAAYREHGEWFRLEGEVLEVIRAAREPIR